MKHYSFSLLILVIALVIHLGSNFVDVHYLHSSKYLSFAIAPLAIAGLVAAGSALSNLVGGIINGNATDKANNTNINIARENNATALRLQQEQNAFNLNQWNATNAYNTPLEQRKRYEAAGINPYMALSSMSNGNVQSSLTAAPTPNLVTPQVQPNTALGFSIGSAISNATNDFVSYANAIKADADAKNSIANAKKTNTETGFIATKTAAEIANLAADTHNKGLQAVYQKWQNRLFEQTFDAQKSAADLNVSDIETRIALTRAQTTLASSEQKVNDSLVQLNTSKNAQVKQDMSIALGRFKQDIRESASRIKLNNASTTAQIAAANNYFASAAKAFAERTKTILESNMINYSPQQLEDLKQNAIDYGFANIENLKVSADQNSLTPNNKFGDELTNGLFTILGDAFGHNFYSTPSLAHHSRMRFNGHNY